MDWDTAIRLISRVAGSTCIDKSGYIKVGYACNNHCVFCTAEWKKSQGDRDTLTIINEVDRILEDDGVSRLVYSGGEPTVRNDLHVIMKHARDLGVPCQDIQTNGRRLQDLGYLQTLSHAGMDSCFVSIHGPVSEIHDKLTRAPGAFNQACAGLANLERIGIPFTTNTVVCRQNYTVLDQTVGFLASTFPSLKHAKLSYPNLQGGAADNVSTVVAPLWEVAPHVAKAIERGNELGIYVETEFMPICLLGKYYDRADELRTPEINVSDLTFTDPEWCRAPYDVGYEACYACDLSEHCCGIHPLHDEVFGEHPCFRPVTFTDLGD